MHWLDFKFVQGAFAVLAALLLSIPPQAAEVKDSLKVVEKTNRSAVASQKKIDGLSRQTQDLLEEYRKLQDGTEYQAAYTRELEELERPSSSR